MAIASPPSRPDIRMGGPSEAIMHARPDEVQADAESAAAVACPSADCRPGQIAASFEIGAGHQKVYGSRAGQPGWSSRRAAASGRRCARFISVACSNVIWACSPDPDFAIPDVGRGSWRQKRHS